MIPFRSLLNVPANRPRMIQRAPDADADALILDLEDSVPIAEKGEARAAARDAIADYTGRGLVTWVRVNHPASGLIDDDLEAVVVPGLAGIQVPKVDDAATVHDVDGRLAALERRDGLPQGAIRLLVSLESARGVFHCHEILSAATRVGSVMVGTAEGGDLQGDVGYTTTGTDIEILHIRSSVLLAARAAGVAHPIDGVYADYRNDAGLEATARRARELGYRGKKVIHPTQVPVVHRVFTPTPAELDHARRVLAAFEGALERGEATAVVDGLMIDYAMAATARRTLAAAAAQTTTRTTGGDA